MSQPAQRVRNVPIVVDGTATTTAALLSADSSADRYSTTRTLLLSNLSTTATLSLLLKAAGTNYAASGLTAADGKKIPAGTTLEISVSGGISFGIVASAACAYNGIIVDV